MFGVEWTQEELQDWFDECELKYEFSHKFQTLSGDHYVFHSESISDKRISVEMFADRYNGLKSNICIIYGNQARQPIWCYDISDDEGIEQWDKKLKHLELGLLK